MRKINNISQYRYIYLTLILLLTLVGCNDADNLSSLTQKSLIYCSEGSPESFNPQTATSSTTIDATSNQIYDRLINLNPIDNSLTPSLAKSWHMTRDGKILTFFLQKNIPFHQTDYFTPSRTMNADDVIFSFERIIDNHHPFHYVGSGRYPYFERVNFSQIISKIEKINQYTVRFNLHHGDSSFLAHLASQYAVILSAEYGQQLVDNHELKQIDTLPIGTGPFKFKEYRVGSLIRFYRHADYWRQAVKIKQLVYDITPSNTARLTKLLTGECDIISQPISHNKINRHKNLTLESITSLDVAFLAFNTLKKPFNDPLIRQAISHAIDKDAIISKVYLNHAAKANSILPPSSWAADSELNSRHFSLETARNLLLQAGYPDGFSMELWAPAMRESYNPNALTMAILIQQQLEKIGITVNIIDEFDEAVFFGGFEPEDYQATLSGWTADQPDPDNFFSTLLSCSATSTGTNEAFWCNQTFDDYLEKSLQTDDIEQRKLYYQQALILLNDKMPVVPIAHSKRYQARNNKVNGQVLNSLGVSFTLVSKK